MPEPDPPDVQILERDGYLEARYLGAYSINQYLRQMERSVPPSLAGVGWAKERACRFHISVNSSLKIPEGATP